MAHMVLMVGVIRKVILNVHQEIVHKHIHQQQMQIVWIILLNVWKVIQVVWPFQYVPLSLTRQDALVQLDAIGKVFVFIQHHVPLLVMNSCVFNNSKRQLWLQMEWVLMYSPNVFGVPINAGSKSVKILLHLQPIVIKDVMQISKVVSWMVRDV